MAKIAEIIYDLRELLKQYTDDSEISDRYILYLYNQKRAKYLRQDLNSFQKTTDISVTQTLCLGLEEVSINDCPVDYNCGTIMRTVLPLPKLLETHLKPSIINIKAVSKTSKPISLITKEKASFLEGSPFKNKIYAFLDTDNKIYLISNSEEVKLMECITITGIFENPLELQKYTNCCSCEPLENPCFNPLTTDYPLQPHHQDNIRLELFQLLTQSLNIPEDKRNNADNE